MKMPEPEQKTILLVDDEKDIREVLSLSLSDMGYRVHDAENGEKALALFRKEKPEYYWQIISYMWLTKFNDWKYCSYDPRFKEEKRMFILNVKLNSDDLNFLHTRCIEAKEIYDSIYNKFK